MSLEDKFEEMKQTPGFLAKLSLILWILIPVMLIDKYFNPIRSLNGWLIFSIVVVSAATIYGMAIGLKDSLLYGGGAAIALIVYFIISSRDPSAWKDFYKKDE